MANLSIRKLNDHVYQQLRVRAALHHVSIEEEVRQIIRQAIEPPEKISDIFRHYFGEKNGVDLDLAPSPPHRPMRFES